MIEKDLQPIYQAMVKTTYAPVILRSIVILLIHDMDRMQAGLKVSELDFREILGLEDAKRALHKCLDNIQTKRMSIIQEILLQYGIDTNPEMNDFYHESFETHFLSAINFVKMLVWEGQYSRLDEIARTQPT